MAQYRDSTAFSSSLGPIRSTPRTRPRSRNLRLEHIGASLARQHPRWAGPESRGCTRQGGAPIGRAALRVGMGGTAAIAVTAAVGYLLGAVGA